MKAIRFKISMLEKQSLDFRRLEADDFYSHFHYHDELQITFIEKGRGTLFIGSSFHSFSEGDIIMIGENTPHLMQKSKDCDTGILVTSFFFNHSLFGLNRLYENDLREVEAFLLQSKRGLLLHKEDSFDLWNRVYGAHLVKDGFERLILLLKVLNDIRKNENKHWLNDRSPRFDIDDDLGQRLDAVYQYTLQHLKRNISLDEIAEVANLSVSRFCAVFKKHAGTTFIDFLNQLRVEEICFQLTHSDLSISEIAYNSGFRNLSNFNKTFKGFKGKSPSEFRKMLISLN